MTRTRGMVLGKFLPLHKGHEYLISFARHYVDELYVVVGTLEDEPIPGRLRYEWVKESFPGARVIHLDKELPQEPHEHPDFWGLWQRSLEEVLPVNPDLVFASEGYGFKLAEVLGARFVPVDMSRLEFPISGTQIRQNPFGHWEFLAAASRSYYLKRVCIFGPESCGKTTLARALAERYGTIMVPEYARTHLDSQNGDISQKDIPLIAKGHLASEKALLKHANRMAFLDTDLLLTTIWSRWLYDDCPEWIQREALDRSADLYILVGIDTPWVDDGVRYLPTERQSFLERCHDVLTSAGKPFVFVEGSHHDRMASVEVAIRENFGEFF